MARGGDQASGHQQGRLRPVRDLQRGGARRAAVDDRAPRPPRRRGPGARSAGQRRRAAERGRAVGEPVPRQGRAGRLHRQPHDGPSRLRGRRRPAAAAPDRRPDQPRHRLGGRDPRLGARRPSPGDDRRHALVRQGHLPGGDPPGRGRGAGPDRGRVLHGGRNLARRQGDQARRQGRGRSGDAAGRGRCARRSRCSPRRWPSRTGEPLAAAGRSGRRVATVERRGRFTIAEPLFERGPQVALARGSIDVGPGEIALVDFGPGGARALRALGSAESARDVVAALLWDRGMDRGFAAGARVGGRRRRRARRARRRWRAATSLTSPRSRSTRRRRATSTTPSRPRPRGTACGSGSTSPTSRPTCGPAAGSTPRRFAAAPAPTCQGRSSRCFPRR